MQRILMRSGKHPATALSAETTLSTNLMGGNIGNFLFSYSAHRMLSRPDTDVVAHGLGFLTARAERISADYDHLVLPLANAFRPGFTEHLDALAALIEKLTIPVTVLSVGAQASLVHGTAQLSPLDESVLRFGRAVLEKSPSIGVRGETTAEYLTDLGLPDVKVIGCPSAFLHGPDLRVEKARERIDHAARVSFSVTPHVLEMGDITMRHVTRFPHLTYIPQDVDSLRLMVWGTAAPGSDPVGPMPFHPAHPVFRRDLARFFLDPAPWIDYLSTVDFAFGDRIHGTMAAILAGTPALLLAHDSRTLELARHHGIPHVLVGDLEPDMDAVDFYELADYTAFNAGQAGRWARFEAYLTEHGLRHAFDEPEHLAAFDAQVAAAGLPPPVRAVSRRVKTGHLDRTDFLYREVGRIARAVTELEQSRAEGARTQARVQELEARVAALTALPDPPPGPVTRLRRATRRLLRRRG